MLTPLSVEEPPEQDPSIAAALRAIKPRVIEELLWCGRRARKIDGCELGITYTPGSDPSDAIVERVLSKTQV